MDAVKKSHDGICCERRRGEDQMEADDWLLIGHHWREQLKGEVLLSYLIWAVVNVYRSREKDFIYPEGNLVSLLHRHPSTNQVVKCCDERRRIMEKAVVRSTFSGRAQPQ